MDAAASEAFVQYVKHQRLIVDHVFVATFTLLYYDYLLTVCSEIALIWYSPWNYTKVLFILARYIPILYGSFFIYDQMCLNNSMDTCEWTFQAGTWLIQVGIPVAEGILALRTWAVWRRDPRIGVGLAILISGCLILECIFTYRYSRSLKFDPPLYVGFRGCSFDTTGRPLFIVLLVIGMTEIVVLGLMMISAFRLYRSGDRNELSNIIHRDGVLFYIYLLCVTLVSIVMIASLPLDLHFILIPFLGVLYSVSATRIIINIRSMGRRGTGESITELHHGYRGTEPTTIPMRFLPGSVPKDESETVWTQTTERRTEM
jgi:hypothetical protein